jgi:hypothetical protein
MIRAGLNRWLQAPVATGWVALACALGAIAVPTLVRAALNGVVTGCEFTAYLPFVLFSAIALRWWQAEIVALESVAILGGLFEGVPFHTQPCFLPSAGIFLGSSALMIAVPVVARRVFAAMKNPGADESAGGIVFSLEKGEVWASWYGHGAPMRLGTQKRVSEMMTDFLAQVELGERLNQK